MLTQTEAAKMFRVSVAGFVNRSHVSIDFGKMLCECHLRILGVDSHCPLVTSATSTLPIADGREKVHDENQHIFVITFRRKMGTLQPR
jgi:hypothetical protein